MLLFYKQRKEKKRIFKKKTPKIRCFLAILPRILQRLHNLLTKIVTKWSLKWNEQIVEENEATTKISVTCLSLIEGHVVAYQQMINSTGSLEV